MSNRPLRITCLVIATLFTAVAALAQSIGPGGNVIPPGGGGGNINPWAAINPMVLGAKCDGTTDDSAAFQAALSSQNNIVLPPRVTCVVGNLTFATNQQWMDCQNSILTAAPGSTWAIKFTSNYWQFQHCLITDPNSYNEVSTTLNGAVTGGNEVAVTSAVGLSNGEPIIIQTASGAFFQTKLLASGGIVGNNLFLADNTPGTATGVSVTSAGSGCTVGNALVAQGGGGPPTTFRVSAVSGGTVTGLTVASPGFYSTLPGTNGVGVRLVAPNAQGCQGVVATITFGEFLNGATVIASWGSLMVVNSSHSTMTGVECLVVVSCAGFYNTNPTSSAATEDTVNGLKCNSCKMNGLVIDAGVNNSDFSDVFMFGAAHDGVQAGSVGLYRNFENPAWSGISSGGNHFKNVTSLDFEIGSLIRGSSAGLTNDFYDDGWTNDTNQYYGVVCDGCNNVVVTSISWQAFTGAGGGYGIGWYQGKYTPAGQGSPTPAVSNIMPGIVGGENAADFYFSDWFGDGTGTGSGLSIGNGINDNQTVGGISAAILSARPIIAGTSGTIQGGGTTTIYIGNGAGYSTSGDFGVYVPIPNYQTVTSMYCHSSQTPTGNGTYTCNLRDFPGPTDSESSIASCVIPAGQFQCTYVGMGVNITANDLINFSIVPNAGTGTAPAAIFEAAAAGF